MRIVLLDSTPAYHCELIHFANEYLEQGGSVSIDECRDFAHARSLGSLDGASVVAVCEGSSVVQDLPEMLQQAGLDPVILGLRFESDGLLCDIWDPVKANTLESLPSEQLMFVLNAIVERMVAQREAGELAQIVARNSTQIAKLTDSAFRCFDRLAHDFRTPLTVIRDYTELLRDDLVGPTSRKQKECLTAVQDRVEELTYIVDDMLDIRRSQMGLLTMSRKPVDVGPRVAQVIARLQRRASSKDVKIDLNVEGVLPKAYCDAERLQRVVYNLVLNAVKYANEGEAVDVRVHSVEETGQLAIEIRDSFGVSAGSEQDGVEQCDRLLEEFNSAHVGLDVDRGDIVGPGLGIARDVVRKNFGNLTIKSDCSEGTTMIVTLPTCDVRSLVAAFLERIDGDSGIVRRKVLYRIRPGQFNELDPSPVIEDFIHGAETEHGFVLPTNGHNWLWLVACEEQGEQQLVEGLQTKWAEVCGELPDTEMPDLIAERIVAWNDHVANDVVIKSCYAAFKHLRQLEAPRPRVLLANDDLDSLAGMVARLERFGYEVTSTINGQQCLQAAMNEVPDAILIDFGMSGREGQSAYEALQKDGRTMNVPILMLADDLRTQQKAMEQGMQHVMARPFEASRLRSTIEELMSTT